MKLETVTDQPVIEAERLTLRPPRRSDLGLLGLYASDKRVACMTRAIPHPLPPGATEAFLRRAQAAGRSEDFWVIDGARAGMPEVTGLISLERMDRGQDQVSYWVAPAFWNGGVASEAVRALIEANPHRACAVFAEVFQDNPGSARVLTNCGFDYLGDAEAFCVARGATVSTWTYSRKMT